MTGCKKQDTSSEERTDSKKKKLLSVYKIQRKSSVFLLENIRTYSPQKTNRTKLRSFYSFLSKILFFWTRFGILNSFH